MYSSSLLNDSFVIFIRFCFRKPFRIITGKQALYDWLLWWKFKKVSNKTFNGQYLYTLCTKSTPHFPVTRYTATSLYSKTCLVSAGGRWMQWGKGNTQCSRLRKLALKCSPWKWWFGNRNLNQSEHKLITVITCSNLPAASITKKRKPKSYSYPCLYIPFRWHENWASWRICFPNKLLKIRIITYIYPSHENIKIL